MSYICPHSDCGKSFDDVIYHQSIIFCPHCQKSLLVNPFSPDLEQMTFWQFAKYFTKRQYKLYAVIFGVFTLFYAIIFIVDNFDELNIGAGVWITAFSMIALLVIVGIYHLEKGAKKYHFYKIKNKPILNGVDTNDDVKDNFNISLAHDELKTTFDRFAIYCPNCQSQRLHKTTDDDFMCQNCHTTLRLNPKLKIINAVQSVLHYIVIFMAIPYSNHHIYPLFLVIPVLFFIHLIIQYHWYKTPKWLL